MIITTNTVDDFLKVLGRYLVANGAVHVDRTKNELSEASDQIFLQASSIIEYASGGQALVRVGVDCGINRKSEGETEGSDEQAQGVRQIADFCDSNGLELLPGMIDLG